jgi:ribonuclease Z
LSVITVIVLGSGGLMPNDKRNGPTFLVKHEERLVLVDAGRGIVNGIAQAGLKVTAVDVALITHLHLDHISDLGDLIITRWFKQWADAWYGGTSMVPGGEPGQHVRPLTVVGPPGIAEVVKSLLHGVYRAEIEWRLRNIRDWSDHPGEIPAPDVRVVETVGGAVDVPSVLTVRATEVEHGGRMYDLPDWHALAYRMEVDGKSVVFSGDAGADSGLDQFAAGANVLFHNCYLPESQVTERMEEHTRLLFASASQVGRIAQAAGVGRLVLTHFDEEGWIEEQLADARRAYAGVLVQAEDLMQLEV